MWYIKQLYTLYTIGRQWYVQLLFTVVCRLLYVIYSSYVQLAHIIIVLLWLHLYLQCAFKNKAQCNGTARYTSDALLLNLDGTIKNALRAYYGLHCPQVSTTMGTLHISNCTALIPQVALLIPHWFDEKKDNAVALPGTQPMHCC